MKEKIRYFTLSFLLTTLAIIFAAGLGTVDVNTRGMTEVRPEDEAAAVLAVPLDPIDLEGRHFSTPPVEMRVLNQQFTVPTVVSDGVTTVRIAGELVWSFVLWVIGI